MAKYNEAEILAQTIGKYGKILNLSRPESSYPKASAEQRASQFMPFDALTGYSDEIDEASRLTDETPFVEDDEYLLAHLNECINILKNHPEEKREITFVIFIKDKKKEGGRYQKIRGVIRKIDETIREFVLEDRRHIPFDMVVDIIIKDRDSLKYE